MLTPSSLIRTVKQLTLLMLCTKLAGCASTPTTATVEVPGTTIAYALSGTGTPTIVLQAGHSNNKNTFASFIPLADKTYRVFAYDRPGSGGSGNMEGPRDACTIAAEERSILRAAGVKPPYILVGHSLGGLYQYVYAKMYPEDVSAVLLLDPTHPWHWATMQREAPNSAMIVKGLRAMAFSSMEKREFDAQEECLERINMSTPLAMPSKILLRTTYLSIEQGPFEVMVKKLQADWLGLTGAQQLEFIKGSGHFIHKDKPAAVLKALEILSSGTAQ